MALIFSILAMKSGCKMKARNRKLPSGFYTEKAALSSVLLGSCYWALCDGCRCQRVFFRHRLSTKKICLKEHKVLFLLLLIKALTVTAAGFMRKAIASEIGLKIMKIDLGVKSIRLYQRKLPLGMLKVSLHS